MKGPTRPRASITAKATAWWRSEPCSGMAVSDDSSSGGAADVVLVVSISGRPPEQARGLDHQHDGHDHEDHGARGLREEHLGEPLDDAEREAGEHRAHDRAHAA